MKYYRVRKALDFKQKEKTRYAIILTNTKTYVTVYDNFETKSVLESARFLLSMYCTCFS